MSEEVKPLPTEKDMAALVRAHEIECDRYGRGERDTHLLRTGAALYEAYVALIDAARAGLADSERQHCAWTLDDDGVYDTSCGNRWFFDTGTATENKARFCPYCGNSLLDKGRAQTNTRRPHSEDR